MVAGYLPNKLLDRRLVFCTYLESHPERSRIGQVLTKGFAN
jgi:hypothetical protein